MRIAGLVLVAGCYSHTYRYLDTDRPAGPAIDAVISRAEHLGYETKPLAYTPNAIAVTSPSATIQVRGIPTATGSRLEAQAPLANDTVLLDRLVPGGRDIIAEPVPGLDRFAFDYAVDGGIARDPSVAGPTWRVDVVGRAGWRFWRSGGDDPLSPTTRHGLALLGGLGASLGPTPAFRAEVELSYDRVATVSPIPGTQLAVERPLAFDFSVASLTGSERHGIEAGVAVRNTKWGGLFVRGGYLWGAHPGYTAVAGAQLGWWPSARLTVAAAGAALIVGAIAAKLSDGISHLGGN